MELKRQNVDVNPEYSDSLDSDLFTVHLMFEKVSASGIDLTLEGKKEGGGRQLPLAMLPNRHQSGKEAFEAGLDEVCIHR